MISYALTQKNTVKLITGDYYKGNKRNKANKRVIVFDLDETIGHFHHLHIIYKCLVEVLKRELTQSEFNQLLDLFPEFFRPGILLIFDFLFSKKRDHSLFKLYIYTNNQCSEDWAKMIAYYIQSKVSADVALFDKIIGAFKIKNKVIELKRTSSAKTYSDFVKCAMLPENTVETCFIDNTYYEKMCESKVYYILPKAYFHSLKKAIMIQRTVSLFSTEELKDLLNSRLTENNRPTTANEVSITKKIMYLVREFLYSPKYPHTNKTLRRLPQEPHMNKKSRRQYKI